MVNNLQKCLKKKPFVEKVINIYSVFEFNLKFRGKEWSSRINKLRRRQLRRKK